MNSYLLQETSALVAAAEKAGFSMRLLGGLAIRTRCPSSNAAPWSRVCDDCDFFAKAKSGPVEAVFLSRGWTADAEFNLYNGETRLSFYAPQAGKKADVFLEKFHMCHTIPLANRVAKNSVTLPLAELLLTKLQVVETNEKDLRDISCILLDNSLAADDDAIINTTAFASACSADWGLWKTVSINLDRLRAWLPESKADEKAMKTISMRSMALTQAIINSPKTMAWKTRSLIGEKLPWSDMPEEVNR